jgi:hypothetical protein
VSHCLHFSIPKICPSRPKAQASSQAALKSATGHSNRKKWLHPSPRPLASFPVPAALPKGQKRQTLRFCRPGKILSNSIAAQHCLKEWYHLWLFWHLWLLWFLWHLIHLPYLRYLQKQSQNQRLNKKNGPFWGFVFRNKSCPPAPKPENVPPNRLIIQKNGKHLLFTPLFLPPSPTFRIDPRCYVKTLARTPFRRTCGALRSGLAASPPCPATSGSRRDFAL